MKKLKVLKWKNDWLNKKDEQIKYEQKYEQIIFCRNHEKFQFSAVFNFVVW